MIDPVNPEFKNTPNSINRPKFGYVPVDPISKPVISILTPFFNTNEVFHETAKSIFSQSLQQWEWVIVNDGSTDKKSLEILEEYREIDPRIRIIDLPMNVGVSAARNIGFKNVRTKYVLKIDTDDLLETTAAEKWLWFIDAFPEYSFVKGINIGFGARNYLWDQGFHLGAQILKRNLVNPTCMIKTDVHQAVGGYDEDIRLGLEDWDFWLKCANAGFWGGTLFEYLDWYRNREDHSDRWANYNPEGISRFQKSIPQRYPNLTKQTFPKLKHQFQGAFANINLDIPCQNNLKKEKPRLLLIVPWLRVGGADQFNINLIKQLAYQGWEITVVATLDNYHPWHYEFSKLTPDIFILPNFLRVIDYPRFLKYIIQSRNHDIVMVTNSEFGYFILPYLRSYFPDIPFVDYNHIEEEHWKNGCHPREGVEYQYWLDGSIVASQHLKDWMVNRGANGNFIDVCYINVDTEYLKPDPAIKRSIRSELGIDEKTPVISYIGRIVEQKQPKVFAETIRKLKKNGNEFRAIVVGEGPDLPWLKSFINANKLSEIVIFTGNISNMEVKNYLNASDILFLPSKWEGIALTIYEAMACGIPVVGANVGGQKELVNNETGILINKEGLSQKEQAEKYAVILENIISNPKKIKEMGYAARQRVVDHFSLTAMGARMINLFEKAKSNNISNRNSKSYLPEYGYASAVLATEYSRISRGTEESLGPIDQSVLQLGWKKLFYLSVRKMFFTFYKKYELKIQWLPRFKEWLKEKLQR